MSKIDNQMYIVDRKLGFIEIYTWNPTFQEVILSYCEKHSALWNTFLGWRRSFELYSHCYMGFWIPAKKLYPLKRLAEEKEREKENE